MSFFVGKDSLVWGALALRRFVCGLVVVAGMLAGVFGGEIGEIGGREDGTIGLASTGLPNLVPQNVVLSSYAVLPGDVITVDWTMTNSGSGFVFATFTGVRLGTSPNGAPVSSIVDLTFTTPEIPAKSAVKQSVSVTIPSTLPLGTYYIWVIADVFRSISQTSSADDAARSAALTVQSVRGQPNLRPLDITVSPGMVRPGDLLTVMWTLTNTGSVTCPASFTGLHLGTSRFSPPVVDGLNLAIATPQIPANSSVRFTNVVTIPLATSLDTYYLWVVADDVVNSSLNQSSREDDAARSTGFSVALELPRPNLVPLAVTLNRSSARPGDLVTVMWTLTNSGSGICPASITGLHLGVSGSEPPLSDLLNVKVPTPEVAAGASVRLTNTVTIPSATPFGAYFVWVVADDVVNSTLNQTSRADDAARSPVLTIAAVLPQPNLIPKNIQLSAYSVRPGDLLTVMWTTTNAGNGLAVASFTGLHLGTSATQSPALDGLNIQLPTPEIAAQSAIRQTNTVTIPGGTVPGNYYVWVVVDDVPVSILDQSSRADDAAPSAVLAVVTVAAQPNLVPQNVVLNTDFAKPGDTVTVRWTMKNLGNVRCPASFTGLRLGQSATNAPTTTNSSVQLLLETPEIAAGGTLEQTNTFRIPTNAVTGIYYVWVIADDVTVSNLNQSSRADDAARSGPLVVATELPRPNLAPSDVTLSVASVQAGGQVTVTWTTTNSGNANCPVSITGLHLGPSASEPPDNDSLNLKILTPAITAQSSVSQTNVVTIPANMPAGIYYVWVVADDVANSTLNQSSRDDDAARSGPLAVTVESSRPNLVPSNVGLSVDAVRPGGQVTVTWTMSNSGSGNCPASTTGLHLGTSASAPPTSDILNLKIATPAIGAQSSLRQTNAVTVPVNAPGGTYYLWVVADDAADSTLNQSSKLDDAARSGPLAVFRVTLIAPAPGEMVSAPPQFRWTAAEVPGASVYLANKAAPILGTDTVVFLDNPTELDQLQATVTAWAAAVSGLGYAADYYWTVGSGNAAQRQVYGEWRAFQTTPLASNGTIVPGSGGDFRFEVVAANQAQVVVEGSENLSNWVELGTVTNSTGKVIFTDETASEMAKRFYRAK